MLESAHDRPTSAEFLPMATRLLAGALASALLLAACGPEAESEASAAPAAPVVRGADAAARGWTEADFIKLMRTGTRPDGRVLNSFMPWPYYAQMTDDELKAIWRFLQAVTPRVTGTR